MYVPKHFAIEELVPQSVYNARGEKAWQLLDDRMLRTIDDMREAFGPMIINTWHSPKLQRVYGYREHSGLRTIEFYEETYGPRANHVYHNSYSQHKYGRAFDCLFRDHTADEVRAAIRKQPKLFPFLTAIETNISWFHGDCRNVQGLMEFKP